jgi:Ca-activated chloride channel homolog
VSVVIVLYRQPQIKAQEPQQAPPSDFQASSIPESPYDAAKAYEAGRYGEAAKGFGAAFDENPDDLKALQALGSSYFKQGDYERAAQIFSALSKKAKTGRQMFEALYDLGNAYLWKRDYLSAISNYEKALKIKPDDQQAQHNLEIAKKLLEEQERTPTPTPMQTTPSPTPATTPNQESSSSSQSLSSSTSQSTPSASSSSSATTSNQAAPTKSSNSSEQSSENSAAQSGQSSSKSQPVKSEQSSSQSSGQSAALNSVASAHSSSSKISQGPDGQQSSQASSGNSSFKAWHFSSPPDFQPEFGRGEKQDYDEAELKREEAKAWLDSLPDSPVLLMRKSKNKSTQIYQTW